MVAACTKSLSIINLPILNFNIAYACYRSYVCWARDFAWTGCSSAVSFQYIKWNLFTSVARTAHTRFLHTIQPYKTFCEMKQPCETEWHCRPSANAYFILFGTTKMALWLGNILMFTFAIFKYHTMTSAYALFNASSNPFSWMSIIFQK